MSNPVILEMKGIVKSFGPVKALKGVDFDLRTGEVHALMGENGAGKSTLMKVLTGIYGANEGTIHYNGKQVEYSKPKEAMDDGIVIVHQELNMMNHLTVAQNIFIGREEINQGLFINDNAGNKKEKELFKLLKLDINPQEKVGKNVHHRIKNGRRHCARRSNITAQFHHTIGSTTKTKGCRITKGESANREFVSVQIGQALIGRNTIDDFLVSSRIESIHNSPTTYDRGKIKSGIKE